MTNVMRPWLLAASTVAFLWLCQFATVRYNYGGNWTGLFCIGPHMPVPKFLRAEHLYLFEGTGGYDGQIFHLIAHDPWMTKGSAAAIGGADFRYQRILVPALAWMLALGRDENIHAAYFAVILAFASAGVFWLARLAQLRGRSPAWGLAFLLVPATITSLDRMTADIALAALCVAFVRYSHSTWRIFAILACAALTRETAVPIVAGYCLYLLTRLEIARSIAAACSLLPAGAWFMYVTHGSAKSEAIAYVNPIPLYGFFERLIHPAVYSVASWKASVTTALDYVALAGVALMLISVARMARWTVSTASIYFLAIAVVFLGSRAVWIDAYNFGRSSRPSFSLYSSNRGAGWPPLRPWP